MPIDGDGVRTAEVLPIDLRALGEPAGFFGVENAGPEGLLVVPTGLAGASTPTALVAAERQPSGLLAIALDRPEEPLLVTAFRPSLCYPPQRSPDLAGLAAFEGRVFALSRSASAIVEHSLRASSVEQIGEPVSFAHIENSRRWAFSDRRYGIAEGLAVDRDRFYVVLDNNDDERVDGSGRRPLLVVLERRDR